jgi:hypothetical protein
MNSVILKAGYEKSRSLYRSWSGSWSRSMYRTRSWSGSRST